MIYILQQSNMLLFKMVFFAVIYVLGEWMALSVFIYISFGQAHLGFVKVILFLHIQFHIQMSWDVPRNCFNILLK